jgi:nucleoside-diphosphate kinase
MEQTLIVIKPDAMRRGLAGEVITRFENKGFDILNVKFICMTSITAEALYLPHRGKDFYHALVNSMVNRASLVCLLFRHDAIQEARKLIGAEGRAPGTIRGDFATSVRENLVHASDSREAFLHESGIFFGEPSNE